MKLNLNSELNFLVKMLETRDDYILSDEDYQTLKKTLEHIYFNKINKQIRKNDTFYLADDVEGLIKQNRAILGKLENNEAKEVLNTINIRLVKYLRFLRNGNKYQLHQLANTSRIEKQSIIDECAPALENIKFFDQELVSKKGVHYKVNYLATNEIVNLVSNNSLINHFRELKSIRQDVVYITSKAGNIKTGLTYLALLEHNINQVNKFNELINEYLKQLKIVDDDLGKEAILNSKIRKIYGQNKGNGISLLDRVVVSNLRNKLNKVHSDWKQKNNTLNNLKEKILLYISTLEDENLKRLFKLNFEEISTNLKTKIVYDPWNSKECAFDDVIASGKEYNIVSFLITYMQSINSENLSTVINNLQKSVKELSGVAIQKSIEFNKYRRSLNDNERKLVINDADTCFTLVDLVDNNDASKNPLISAIILDCLNNQETTYNLADIFLKAEMEEQKSKDKHNKELKLV
jgi:hypothetical protein